jgi:hypothetical protein
VSRNNAVILFFQRLLQWAEGLGGKSSDELLPDKRFDEVKAAEDSGIRELVSNTLEFDIGSLLRPRSFLYILAGMGIILFQTYNNLAINNLALQNEQLREQIQMTSSVITSQELKMHELHSIRNIAQDAAVLGLAASSIPPVELVP